MKRTERRSEQPCFRTEGKKNRPIQETCITHREKRKRNRKNKKNWKKKNE